MRFVDLFSGIGGLSLGLERAGMTCAAQVEIDEWCCNVLAHHWAHVPRWNDVKDFKGEFVKDIELVCGGFPCQDISTCGKGRGLAGERSGLWFEMLRIINETRPSWVLAENVAALRFRGADEVIESLEALGYTAWPLVVGADDIGATHKRDRVWIVAYAGRVITGTKNDRYEVRNSLDSGRIGSSSCDGKKRNRRFSERREILRFPSPPNQAQQQWENDRFVELKVGRTANGISGGLVRRTEEEKQNQRAWEAYGNAVVPQVVEMIGRAILKADELAR